MTDWSAAIKDAMLDGEAEETMDLVRLALADGVDPNDIVRTMVDGMCAVGRDYKNGEFYIPDVLLISRASQAVLYMLRKQVNPELLPSDKGLVMMGTVAGDLHDIGKNTARFSLEAEGYKVIDLGIDVVPEVFAREVAEKRPKVLGISALLTTTVGEMPKIIKALEKAGVRDSVQVYVSGVPVTRELAERFGADHYCEDARDTVDYVNEVFARG